jgi:hypothetical protein
VQHCDEGRSLVGVAFAIIESRPAVLNDAEDDDSFVVEVLGSGLKVGDGFENGVHCGLRGGMVLGLKQLGKPFVAEHLAGGIFSVDDAVGEEDDEVAGASGKGELLVFDVWKEAQGKAFGLNGAYSGGLAEVSIGGNEEWLDGAGIGNLERLVAVVPYRHEHRNVLRVELAFLKLIVESSEHRSRGEVLRSQ